MKKDATVFALIGSAMTAALFIIVNFITTPGVLWFFYPVFAIVWWPLSLYFCGKRQFMAFAWVGSALITAFLAAVNLIHTPQNLWFPLTLPVILCWPAGVYLHGRKKAGLFALLGGLLLIAYCTVLNLIYTPNCFWAIYPIYLILWWPVSSLCTAMGDSKKFSVLGSILTIAFLVVLNLLHTAYPWALYACFPVILWPAAMYAIPKTGAFRFSVLGALAVFIWYGALNILLEPGSPWSIFVAFAAAWAPLSVYYYGRGKAVRYALVMTALSAVFFTAVNIIYSPGAVWAFYPVFAMLWWPLSVFYYGRREPVRYAAVMTGLSIAFFAAMNLLYTPGTPWAFYPAFALVWWPMTLFFARKTAWITYSIAGSLLTVAFLAAVNLLYSPGTPWVFYPAFALAWWPMTMSFARMKAWFAHAVAGSLLTIAFLAAVNLLYTPGFLWSAFPALAILWWPLAVYFKGRRNPLGFAIEGSILAILLFVAVNLMTSPGFLWCVFPAFAVLWWPLSVFFHNLGRRRLAR
jgi:hypothetical protein